MANILSQPTVVTLNNLEAVIQRQQRFTSGAGHLHNGSLRYIGGAVMKVTPHVIEETTNCNQYDR
jgi:type II secretory pathway component GspD/PulD (secretin)